MAEREQAVVVGGSGEVGEGVVAVLLEQDWQVTVLGRSADRLAELAARLDEPAGLTTAVVAPGDDSWPDASVLGRPRLAVASIGGWFSGPPLTSLPLQDWDRVLRDSLTAHLLAAQAILPVQEAAAGGTYVLLNGAAAFSPVPGSGVVSTVAAGQLMLARALAAEAVRVTVRNLVISTPVLSRSRPSGPGGWVSARDVGAEVLRLHHEPGDEVVVPFPALA